MRTRCAHSFGEVVAWLIAAALVVALAPAVVAQDDPAACFDACTEAGGSIQDCSAQCGHSIETPPPPAEGEVSPEECFQLCLGNNATVQECAASCGYEP